MNLFSSEGRPASVIRSRRSFLNTSGVSLSSAALAGLLAENTDAAPNASVARQSHHTPRAKNVIYLHMIGAPSHLDMFDDKPELRKRHNEPCPAEVTKDRDFAFIGKTSTLAGSPWKFRRNGQSGQVMSELLPHLGTVADELAVLRSLHNAIFFLLPVEPQLALPFKLSCIQD